MDPFLKGDLHDITWDIDCIKNGRELDEAMTEATAFLERCTCSADVDDIPPRYYTTAFMLAVRNCNANSLKLVDLIWERYKQLENDDKNKLKEI